MGMKIWEDHVDKKYPCFVERDEGDPYKGKLVVMDGEEIIFTKDVGISFGGPFGPDAGDVAIWQSMSCDAVDVHTGKLEAMPGLDASPAEQEKPTEGMAMDPSQYVSGASYVKRDAVAVVQQEPKYDMTEALKDAEVGASHRQYIEENKSEKPTEPPEGFKVWGRKQIWPFPTGKELEKK